MGEVPALPSKAEIEKKADDVWKAAVRVRGEKELRFIPEDPGHPARGIAGKSVGDYPARDFGHDPQKMTYLGTVEEWNALRAEYAWIVPTFRNHLDPEPTNFDPLISTLERTALAMYNDASPGRRDGPPPQDPIGGYAGQAKSLLSDWRGTAATVFMLNFVDRLPLVAQHQAFLAGTLEHAMRANKEIFVRSRQSLWSIADMAVAAIEASVGKGGKELAAVLNVVAAVATIAAGISAIPITGGASLAVVSAGGVAAWTIVAGGSSALAQAAGHVDDPIRNDLSADTVDGVLQKMHDAVIKVLQEVSNQERKIVSALDGNYAQVTNRKPGGRDDLSPRDAFLASRPKELITATGNGTVRDVFLPP